MMMRISCFSVIAAFIFLLPAAAGDNIPFDQNYEILYGSDHADFNPGKTQVKLTLDDKSGAAFGSKLRYNSGYFNMSIKLPPGDSAGVIVAFYLRSEFGEGEIDFEFMGNEPGKNITLQTNVFANGRGDREQRIVLPNAQQETYVYTIVWNPSMIMMLWEGLPIRVFKNMSDDGIGYPWKPMQVLASIWDGSAWATDGGRTKIDWAHAPFNAEFVGFNINGCPESSDDCGSDKYWWNRSPYSDFSPGLQDWMKLIKPLLGYDYCTDTEQHPIPPPECSTNVVF